MVSISSKWIRLVVVMLSLVASPHVFAVGTCAVDVKSVTIPLAPANITAGPDLPDGTILYTGYHSTSFSSNLKCTGENYSFAKYLKILSAPTALSGWSNSQFSHVYSSGVPGIGIVVWKGSVGITPTPYAVSTYNSPSGNLITTWGPMDASFNFGLIKTGNIEPGTINGSSFPTVFWGISNISGVTNIPPDLELATINFIGTINVVSKTCATPDVTVSMGSYEIAKHFKTVGTTTPWMDASIVLTGCPYFYGYYGTNNQVTFNSTGGQTIPASTANTLGVPMQPTSSVIDAANGIMAIDSTVSNAASGVGIQLGWGDYSQTPALFNFAAQQTVTLPKDGTSTIRIPLAARYIQTDASPTPGPANGKVVFTINYY